MKRYDRIEKNRANLVHSRTEQEKAPRSFSFFYFLLIIIFLGGAIYLIFYSTLLDIKGYEVRGYSHPETITTLAKEESQKSLFGDNILFFRAGEITEIISGDPSIESVSVKRKFPASILIEIEETKPALIWSTAGENFLISDRGTVMEKSQDEKLPIIFDAANIKVNLGERVVSPTFINFIKTINEKFEGATGVGITRINIFDILSDVHVVSAAGWTVYLDSSKDADVQLSNLTRVLAEAKQSSAKKLEYIDMRVDTKIYYK